MRLALLIALTMTAFAANSLLTRAALDGGHIAPAGFAVLRVASGAAFLTLLVALRRGAGQIVAAFRPIGAVSLAIYMIGFTLAYLTLDAGFGALVLFGVVQLTMFLFSAVSGSMPTARQMAGACVAFAGLALALWPDPGMPATLGGAALMALAGLGWAFYTISGSRAADPLAATSANFIACLPIVLGLLAFLPFEGSLIGVGLGVLCGAVTSGLGYALWYHVLTQISGPLAATVQLSVPIIAIVLGALFLAEPISVKILIAAFLVVGGIGWSVSQRRVQT